MAVFAHEAAIVIKNAQLFEEVERLKNRLQAENLYLREELELQHNFEEIIGDSPAMKAVFRKAGQVAPTDSTVLILGETGTVKELIARAIHNLSSRRERALVRVNCAAIPANLVESDLFGHEKGSFTGALSKRIGRFELADGGTILLDEVGELPTEAQAKLLRVLQEREFDRVGSHHPTQVNVRVIAVTNRDLQQAVKAGTFRANLLYRLDVFLIEVPPLRARTSDIPLLVRFYAGKFSKKFSKRLEDVSQRTMERLTKYGWPGNVRELEHVIERAAILSQGPLLQIDESFLNTQMSQPTPAGTLEEVEKAYIIQVLRETDWVVEGDQGAAVRVDLRPLGGFLMPLPWPPNVNRRGTTWPWSSMALAHGGRLNLPSCRIRPMASTIRFAMWFRGYPVDVRRSSGRQTTSNRAGCRW